MTQNEGLQLILLSLLFVYDEYFFILIKNKSEKMMQLRFSFFKNILF